MHLKKYDPKETCANPPHILVGRNENWHCLCDHYMSVPFQVSNEALHNEGTQPLSRNEICETVLGRQPTYSKGLGWGPKPKAHKTASASNSTTSCSQSTVKLQLRVALDKAMLHIEEQTRNHVALASEVERMQKLKDDMS
ncbi:gamma-aminobutyrate transaminase POP2 [Cucumis melo var. makuwa]|uniref:Gamma-aminobutyrate transaminase POP2 n=1 Tax=Cucumis melo var. makuwa TaxID=1194695 RepID=A0A5A7TTJ0_CUCMM|nr:gamma-aminobutyrate transaminase POP2 [Cucumis melo var. makuwa]